MGMVFVLIIILWGCLGVLGITAPKNRVNWELICFLAVVPLLPIIARLCGIF